jgi:hypothetical protein
MTNFSATDRGTGTKATIATNLYLKLSAQYFQNWSENFRSYIGLNFGYFSLEKPSDSRKSIDSQSRFTSGMLLGAETDLSRRSSADFTFRYQKQAFLRSISTTSVAVDLIDVPSISAKLNYDLIELSPFTLGIAGVSELTLPASADSYAVRLGASFGGILYLKQKLAERERRAEQLETSLGFFQRKQNTSLVEQTETDLVLSVRYFFGGGTPKETNASGGK